MSTTSGRKIKMSHVIIASLLLVIILMAGFIYYYLQSRNPVDTVKSLVRRTSGEPQYEMAIYGDEKDPLNNPTYVYAQGSRIYVADNGNGCVKVFNYSGGMEKVIGKGKLQHPFGMAVIGDSLYVADLGLNKIAIFSLDGAFKGYFAEKDIKRPVDVVGKNGKIYVTDIARSEVKVFTSEGKLLLKFGGEGEGKGQLKYPNGLAVDDQGRIYVADSNNNRIQIFDEKGKLLLATDPRNDASNLVIPRGISLTKDGKMTVASPLGNYVAVLSEKGEKESVVGYAENDQDALFLPNCTFVDEEGRLLVADSGNNRIVVFRLPS